MDKAPWWADLTDEEREEYYADACESWHEHYAEAGSGHVFSGGSSSDANLVAFWAAGDRPTRKDYGLPPLAPLAPLPPSPAVDEDIPF